MFILLQGLRAGASVSFNLWILDAFGRLDRYFVGHTSVPPPLWFRPASHGDPRLPAVPPWASSWTLVRFAVNVVGCGFHFRGCTLHVWREGSDLPPVPTTFLLLSSGVTGGWVESLSEAPLPMRPPPASPACIPHLHPPLASPACVPHLCSPPASPAHSGFSCYGSGSPLLVSLVILTVR